MNRIIGIAIGLAVGWVVEQVAEDALEKLGVPDGAARAVDAVIGAVVV